jgi:hypothetical protein
LDFESRVPALIMTIASHPTHALQKPQPEAGTTSPVVQQRPVPTLSLVKTFAEAMFTGKYVAPEIVAQRMAICRQCVMRRITTAGVDWCGACGCRVSRKDREITNLAAYEENLPKWGCKHPLRKKGKGWGAIGGQLSAISSQQAVGVLPNGSGAPLQVADVPRMVSGAARVTPAVPPASP